MKKFIIISIILAFNFYVIGIKAQDTYPSGTLLKAENNSAVYFIGNEGQKHVFPDNKTYLSWYKNFDQVIQVNNATLDNYPDGKPMPYRAGTKLITHINTAKVYAIEPNGVLRWIPSEEIAINLYGNNWQNRVQDLTPGFFSAIYSVGQELSDSLPTGTIIKEKNSNNYYYITDGYRVPFASWQNYNPEDIIELDDITTYPEQGQSNGNDNPIPEPEPEPTPDSDMKWGAFVGYGQDDIANFESLVNNSPDIIAYFDDIANDFPITLANRVGPQGKTMLIYLETQTGYDSIIAGSYDENLNQYANAAKNYGYPIIIVPFAEMNLNEEAWGYGHNSNTPDKFKSAWIHIHDIFTDADNVKFGIAFNNVSIPSTNDNEFSDYYPGSTYVDYVGVDGFNFGYPWRSFAQVFDDAISEVSQFEKPIYIFSMASADGEGKADWIRQGLGSHIYTYENMAGWIWFNENKEENWLINSSSDSLQAFKEILP